MFLQPTNWLFGVDSQEVTFKKIVNITLQPSTRHSFVNLQQTTRQCAGLLSTTGIMPEKTVIYEIIAIMNSNYSKEVYLTKWR